MRRATSMRLFVAAYPPPGAASALLGELDVLTLPPARRTSERQVHLTLVFLGDRRQRDLRDIAESIERSASGIEPFEIACERLFSIPTADQGGPVRLVAAKCDAPAPLLELQRRLAHRLALPGSRSDRFAPHMTLARFLPGAAPGPIDVPIAPVRFEVREIRLVESRLTRDGAVHDVVKVVPLTAGRSANAR